MFEHVGKFKVELTWQSKTQVRATSWEFHILCECQLFTQSDVCVDCCIKLQDRNLSVDHNVVMCNVLYSIAFAPSLFKYFFFSFFFP